MQVPKRTNDFQSLMFLIQSQLAPTGAVVTESSPGLDESIDSDREIDIVISDPKLGLEQRIAIECRDRSRKDSLEWIDAIIGKYSKVQVRRVVAISRSGFTRNALKKARAFEIDTLSLKAALDADWASAVRNVVAALVKAHLVTRMRSDLRYVDLTEPISLEGQTELLNAKVFRQDGTHLADLGKLVSELFEGPAMQQILASGAEQLTETEPYLFCEIVYDFPPGSYLLESGGQGRGVSNVTVLARCRRQDLRIALEHKALGSARIAFGSGDAFGYRVHAAVSQVPDGPLNSGVIVRRSPSRSSRGRRRRDR